MQKDKKKIISILFCFLSLSNTFNVLVYAQEMQTAQSQPLAVGFGINGLLVESATSSPISVLVKDDTPKLYDTNGRSLVKISPSIGVAPQIVIFDASKVIDPENQFLTNPSTLIYSWDFGDTADGENLNTSTNQTATHTYKIPGKYKVTLIVSNANGKNSRFEKEIEVRDKNEAPNADAAYTSNETDDYLEVSFDASMSTDPEGDPISFKWDLSDGTEIADKIFTYKFTKKGAYVPKVTVTDSLGAVTTKYLEPITYLGPNIPPTPIATISPSIGYLSPQLLIKLSAKDSFDKDGEITNYKWTISDSRDEKSEIREGNEVIYEFTQAGTYKVKLTVTDNRNRTVEEEETITVKKPDPIASAEIDKTSGNAPLSIQFNSNGSRDFDGSLVNVKWNFGDDTALNIEPNPIHTYNKPGAYLATLTVTTPDGRIKRTNTKTILVNENNGPLGIISIIEGAQTGVPNEGMIKLSAKGSYDGESNQMLSYSWSWIAQQLDKDKNLIDISEVINKQIKENTNEEFSYTFIAPGQYTPVLEIRTEDGRISKVNGETITIVPGQEPVAIAKITTGKLQGTNLLSVMFDASGSYDPKADGSLVSYFWEFEDGQTSTEITPEHTYNTPGEYNAKLTIQDNRGFKSTALANTVRVTASESLSETNFITRKQSSNLLQVANEPEEETSLLSFSSDEEKPNDSTSPQISLSISNPDLKAGETLSLCAHITDDISVETVGYKLLDESNNIVLGELESAPGNNQIDEFMANVDYTKDILIPQNTPPGKYKLLLFAKDKSDNWIGKIDSNQIISSEVNITGRLEEIGSVLVSGEDLDEKPDAFVISELDKVLQGQTEEERNKLLELVAADKENDTAGIQTRVSLARKYLKEREHVIARSNSDEAISKRYEIASPEPAPSKAWGTRNDINLKARLYAPNINVGRPPAYGAPSVMSYVTSVSPTVSSVMTSQTSTPYIDVSLMTVVNSNNIKNFSHVQISVSPSATAPSAPTQSTNPQIEKTITISCAAGRDCSIYNERIKEIENPTISVTPQDVYGNPLGSTSTLQLNLEEANDVKSPVIDSLEITSRGRGLGTFNLAIFGSMFNETSYILWDGNKLETNYKDPHKLVAYVPASFTFDSKLVKIQVKKQKDGHSYLSNVLNFEVLPKPNDKRFLDFNTLSRIDKEVLGNDETLLRSGGNVYIDNQTTTFKDAGDITLPFVVSHESNLNFEVIGSIVSSSQNPLINLYHNNKLVTSLVSDKAYSKEGTNSTKSKNWKVNLGELPPGAHTIRLSVPDLSNKTIFVLDKFKLGFSEVIRTKVTSVSPTSIYPPNESDRTITLIGTNFGKNPKVLFNGENGELLSTTTITEEKKIEVKLPFDLKLEPDQKNLSVQVLNTESNEKSDSISIGIVSKLEIYSTDATYKFNPNVPNGELKVNLNTTNNFDTAYIGVFDNEGRIVKEPYHEGKTNTPATSFALPYNLKGEKYHVISLLERKNTNANINDYSNKDIKKLFGDLLEKKVKDENDFNQRLAIIPSSHKTTFEIGNYSVPTLKLNGVSIVNGTNAIQENQELEIIVELRGNITDKSKVIIKTNFGDGTEITDENPKHPYKLENNDKNKYFEIITRVIQDSIEIGKNKEGILVYKDLPPVAVASIDIDNYEYQGDVPFKTGFVDKSYDPNDEITNFSGAFDKTIPEQNIWKLFKYKDGISNQIINTEDLSVTGNQVLSGGKSFLTGNILNPGTYYAHLTVFDRSGNSDSTQSETVQITLPTQKLLVHASFDNLSNQAFEYDTEGKVRINFMSNVQLRGSKQPKNIIYNWNFDDGTCTDTSLRAEQSEAWQSPTVDCSSPNPLHIYKRSDINRDKIDFHPELTVTAIWANGYSETWSSKAGTVSIIDKPEFVAIELLPNTTIGNVPLTVNFMISDKSLAKNATIVSYEFYPNVIPAEAGIQEDTTPISGVISDAGQASPDASLNELKQKTFTHTYNTRGDFSPTLKVKTKENPDAVFEFKSPIISTNSFLVSSIEVIEPSDNFVTNQPIQTFKINTSYTNPLSESNRLTVHLTDEDGNETVTELDPTSSNQTLSLSEGVNQYWFELIDFTGAVQKSLGRKISLDTVDPSISNISSNLDNISGNILISGNLVEKNLQKVELQIDDGIPLILSSEDLVQNLGNTHEYSLAKTLENIPNSSYSLTLRAYDLAGNISENPYELNKGNDKVLLKQITQNADNIISNNISSIKKPEKTLVQETAIIGKPFNIELNTCFSDDKNLSHDNVEAKFDISEIKLTGISYNDNPIQKSEAELQSIFDSIVSQETIGCIDLASGISTKLGCTDAYANACRNTCVHLDGPICNVPVLISKRVNDLTNSSLINDLFNPSSDNLDLSKAWNIGKYKLDFEVKENPETCALYGTCLGQNAYDKVSTKTYSFEITIKRQPEVKAEIPKDLKLDFDVEKETTFKVIAVDNIPFTYARKPILDLVNKIWNGNIYPASPNIQIISELIDPNDPKKYIFELKIKLKPNSLKKIDLEIPVIFPEDLFNPNGIKIPVKLTFNKIIANFSNEIISPPTGTLLTSKQTITSQVTKPDNLTGGLNPFDNCNKSVINYGIKTFGSEEIKSISKKSLDTNIEKVGSKGNKYISKIEFKDLLNFNLKNINEFKNNFLSGSIFGPIELYGEYSTSCTDKNLEYTGNPKTYVLFDNTKIPKGKCFYPQNALNTTCKFTLSTNTLLSLDDALSLEIIPHAGTIDSACRSKFSQITFTNPKKLTQTITIDCLPKEATSFEVKLKRNNNFLNKIETKLAGTSLSIINNPDAIIADSKTFTVENVPEEEKVVAFQVGNLDSKTATFNNKTISVRQLKDLLFSLGLISSDENIQDKYTYAINQAYWKLICAIDETKASTLDPSLRLQTAEPLKCGVSYFEGYPDIKYIEDVSFWREFIEGLKARVGEDIKAYVNPMTIGAIASFIAWNSILPVSAWIILLSGFAGSTYDIATRTNEVKELWNNSSNSNFTQTNNWKIGYSIGTLLTAVPGLIPANVAKNVKVAEATSKLDNYTEIQNLVLKEQRTINEVKDFIPQGQRQDELNKFVGIVDKLTESGKGILNQLVYRFTSRDLNQSNIVSQFGSLSEDAMNALIKMNNRDNLTISLNDIELNDLLFVFAKNVEKENINNVIIRVKNNLENANPTEIPSRGIRIDIASNIDAVIIGDRTLSNLRGETFFTKSEDIVGLNGKKLLQKLGLDTISDINNLQGKEIKSIEFDLAGLEITLPIEGNVNFVKGGITSGGKYEAIVQGGKPAQKSANILNEINGQAKNLGNLNLSELEIREMLNESLHPPTQNEINILIQSLKSEGRL